MKALKYFTLFLLGSIVFLSSCRTEETIEIDPVLTNAIKVNSTIASLMSRTAQKDGSKDNIIDNASCLTVKFPVTVTVNGEELVIEGEDDYDMIEELFDALKDDVDTLVISYPIKVVFSDYTFEIINSDAELIELVKSCKGENEDDDDIECIDFKYPIKASFFDENSDLLDTVIIENDHQLHEFIEDIGNYTAVTINFPVKLILANGSLVEVESIKDLEEVIENADNSCDEDDDNDYNDDDCNECSVDKLKNLFDTYKEFIVDEFELNGNHLEAQYSGYLFSFNSDETITVFKNGTTVAGTWEASGTENDMTVVINIPDLPDFNGTWNLHEINIESNKVEIEFKKGENELVFSRTI